MKLLNLFPLLLVVFFTSCVKDIDFEQAEDLSFSPILESSLVNFEQDAIAFYEGNEREDIITITDEVELDLFNGDFTVENLSQADLFFNFKNSIQRPFNIKVGFYAVAGQKDILKHELNFNIEASPTNEDVVLEHLEVFKNESLEALKETSKLILTFSMQKGSKVTNEKGRIKMLSKATFFLDIVTKD